MNLAAMQGLLPLLVLGLGAAVLMLQISIRRQLGWSYAITVATLLLGAAAMEPAMQVAPLQVTPLLRVDNLGLFFGSLFCLSGAVTAVISRDYLRSREGENEEYFLLLLLSTLGAVILAYSTHVAALLLGLELLSVALYALIAYPERGTLPLEAAIKYLVLSGAASATLLFGFALIYAALGSLEYAEIAVQISAGRAATSPALILMGAAMVFAGLGFKLSVVPFHMWTPDVYEGAPAPISGFLAGVSKGAVFIAVLRWFLESGFFQYSSLLAGITLLSIASILVGNLLALLQTNVKRILAYSSIAHLGYLLIVLVAAGVSPEPGLAVEAGGYYVVAYVITTLAAFSLLGLISRQSGDREYDQLSDLAGLFWKQPGLAALFTVALLSLAGIPLTAGFIGKFYLISAGVDAALWGLLAALVIGSAIGIFYYLRIIYTMTTVGEQANPGTTADMLVGSRLVVYLLIFAMLYLGIVPEPLMGYLRTIL
ncbi:MAG: NADH-quinone oxidoreductase subunit N [Gammaproteobacteria bacterium]|nr:NADH-quinone oxidoreductase subunit N [Gammaproteobacteria bacterium]